MDSNKLLDFGMKKIDGYLVQEGFVRSKSEPTLYTKTQGDVNILIVSLYVDDLIFTVNILTIFKRSRMTW